ncbi:Nucleoporin [Fulvia fulva]|uniref:Nucleoporin n=1 Tax=Passalora fulva TaxID=5499 RepID=A0A9Q8PK62_PASFU|nr:Nucleoporin [Fulvia fulva]KAK4611609.1 Nucleoporin [Fulvia fulva]UJO23973.1 Nucleoporin [Fulvia fulva]WPV20834.1 Nucleoporin [Fulvia fulva]WPV36074.1 Nucleoporin [Fulvia fulva]
MAATQTGAKVPTVEDGKNVFFQNLGVGGSDRLQAGESWPYDNLPSPTASLLAIASRKGVLVVGTPTGLDISSTEKTRRSYIKRRTEKQEPVQPLDVDVHIDISRVSHVAFTADEAWLVVASEGCGRLSVYSTDHLANGARPAHEIDISGENVRHLSTNPQDEPVSGHRNVCAVITGNGSLLFIKVSESNDIYSNFQGNKVFYNNVASGTWSKMGKQFVAGLSDGTAVRIDPLNSSKENVVETIPRAPQLDGPVTDPDYSNVTAVALTAISWLKTKGGMSYLFVYSPVYAPYSDPDDAGNDSQESLYFIAERTPNQQSYTFRPFERAPTDDFGMKRRTPASQNIIRLSDWHKAEEILVIGSTVCAELGMVTEFKEAVHDDAPAGYAGYFTDDQHKVSMPYSDANLTDGSPVGLALDLGTTEVAPAPVKDDEDILPHSKLPLPALYVLDFSGILSIYWIVYVEAIRASVFAPGIVHRSGRYAKYQKINPRDTISTEEYKGISTASGQEPVETEPLDATSPTDAPRSGSPFAALPSNSAQSTPSSGAPVASQPTAAFGQPSQQSTSTFGQPSTSGFGQATTPGGFGQPSTPGGFGQPGKPAFGQASTPGGFGQPSKPAFGQASTPGGFGQPSAPAFGGTNTMGQTKSPWGQPAASPAGQSPFGAKLAGPSPFAAAAAGKTSGFGQPSTPGQAGSASAFGSVGQLGANKPNPFGGNASGGTSAFASVGQSIASPFSKPALLQGGSNLSGFGNLSSAESGNTVSGFGSGSSFASSSFNSKEAVSRESTMNEGTQQQSSGLSGMGGFKLGSGFKGDGSAKDDLPMPKNPGAGLFGSDFGNSLGVTSGERPSPFIKQEPGTGTQTSMKDIPAASSNDAPLPPDPSTYKPPKGWNDDIPGAGAPVNMKPSTNDAPLPHDPTTPANWNADIPGAGPAVNAKTPEKDIPIAGSPPVDVTNSQSFGDALSEIAGPSDEDSEDWAEDDDDGEGDEDEEDDDEDEDEDEDDDQEEEEEEEESEEDETADEEVPYQPQNPAGLAAFKARMQPPGPKSPEPQRSRNESRTPQSDEKSMKSSYTPAGLPKGPVFPPPAAKPQHSPRSPSPQRAVTSPVRPRDLQLPASIKATAVPPAKPLERPAPAPKPRDPTVGELADQAAQRVEAELARPVEPTTELPPFYAHTDYTGNVDTPGIGGQIEKVYRDINSMVHTVGLNARSINSFLDGHEKMRQPGKRTRDDLDNPDAWLLGDVADLGRIIDEINTQLENGKLEGASETLADISQAHNEVLKLKAQSTEIRKQVQAHKDPERLAALDAAPLDIETKAQQSELRSGVQRVQQLLADIEQKMTMLRADLASLSHRDGQPNGQSPVPTVEAVMNTIRRMTAAVQQKSADIDFLEAQIKRLPNGIESLRLDDNYEDDLASRLGNNRLLADRGSPAATPPRRPRMAANGDALGMSGMFGTSSRFATPPSASMRQSTRFTPDLGRSTNSLNGSARKKMMDVTAEEVEEFHAKAARRRNVLGALKKRVETNGARVIRAA